MGELGQAAYQVYVERIGKRPAPMTADYGRAVELGHAWVAQHGDRVVGLLVLEPAEDHLLLENVAVEPQAQGSASEAGCCSWPRSRHEHTRCGRSGCTPTKR